MSTITPPRLKCEETGKGVIAIVPRDEKSYRTMLAAIMRAFPLPDAAGDRYQDAIESGHHDERVHFDAAQMEALASVFETDGDVETMKYLRELANRVEGRGRTRLEELLKEAVDLAPGDSPVEIAVRKLATAIRLAARP